MDKMDKVYEKKEFKYGKHFILALFFFFYSYTFSVINSYINVFVSKFFNEKGCILHSRLVLLSYAVSLIIFGIIISLFRIKHNNLSRIIGIITLISSLMIFFMFKTENKAVFLILIYALTFLIGLECVYYYGFMYRAFSYMSHVGLVFAASMSCTILLQYYFQTYIKDDNIVLYSLIVVTFICAFLNLSGATEYLSDTEQDERIISKPSDNNRFISVFIATIIVIMLLELIGNFLSYPLLSLMYSGKAVVYNSPRLFIIISYIIMGILADVSDMNYIPIVTFVGVLIGILNPILIKEDSSIYANSCIYYIVAGIINSFFMLMMFKLARARRFAPLIAVSGRIIDGIFSFIFISPILSSLPLYYIIGIELGAIIIIMLLFTFSGQFYFGYEKKDASWHISPSDFSARYGFTEKETEVFMSALSFDGTMSELAKSLFMSRSVLYRNLSNICDKTGCGSFQAVKYLYYELPAVETEDPTTDMKSNLNSAEPLNENKSKAEIEDTANETVKKSKTETDKTNTMAIENSSDKDNTKVDASAESSIKSFAEKYSLTAKEAQTLSAFFENPDKTQKELADMQGTTLRTIQRHLASIKSKTETKSLIELNNLYNSEK